LTKKLDLTTEQQTKVTEMNQATAKEVEAIKNNTNLSKEEKKNALKQLRETKRNELKAVLSPEQNQKLDKIQEKREHRKENHKKHG
jgi:protein CpxP